jgi:hypothetical protein
MPDFGIFRGFNDKLFGNKLYAGQLPTQLGKIGSESFGYLLNDYPNAAAAYSLRLLRSAYTGNAIRVRRASDNTEQNIGFTIIGGLDTSALTSFCSGTNGFVTTWYDQSGNGNNATQTTAANQPQIVSAGNLITENGKPAAQFDGSDDSLAINYSSVSSFTSISSFIVAIQKSGAKTLFARRRSISVTPTNFALFSNGNIWNGSSYNGAFLSDGSQVLYNFTVDSSSGTIIYKNSTSIFSNSTFFLGVGQESMYIGASVTGEFYDSKIQEIVLYPSNQSSSRTGIESNINTYYGIY